VYAIVRIDTPANAETPLSQMVVVTKVVWEQETAEREVDRLNRLNQSKGALYFWMVTRLERNERDGGI
jgi:hypothetical protein